MDQKYCIKVPAAVVGALFSGLIYAATPCPPPQVSVAGGTTASTTCVMAPVGTYSTNFPATENPLSEGGKWINGKATGLDWNNPLTTGGHSVASAPADSPTRYSDDVAILNPSFQGYTANQYAQATVYKAAGYTGNGGNHEVELLLRFSISNHVAHGYEILWGVSGYFAVVRWNGSVGNYTPIYDPGVGSIPVPQDGDVLRAEIAGNIIKVYRNGTQVGPNIDVSSVGTVYTSGQPGIGFWPVDGATPGSMGWKTFAAGNS